MRNINEAGKTTTPPATHSGVKTHNQDQVITLVNLNTNNVSVVNTNPNTWKGLVVIVNLSILSHLSKVM